MDASRLQVEVSDDGISRENGLEFSGLNVARERREMIPATNLS